jgi:hypothetical protein
MTANDRNRYAFSYNSLDVRNKNFIFKNFNKSCSFKSNFSNSTFKSTSFIGAKFKFCSLYNVNFEGCLIRGVLFKKCNLTNAKFINSIISATIFDKNKLTGCQFINCKVINTEKLRLLIPKNNFVNTDILESYPDPQGFSDELLKVVENLRSNKFIRKSTILHRKKGQLDTVSISILVSQFGETFLVKSLPKIAQEIKNEFHTLSYIQSILNNINNNGKLISPPPVLPPMGFLKLTTKYLSTD